MTNIQDIVVCDIESDGLLDTVTKIHCIVTSHNGTIKRWHESPLLERDGTLQDGINYLQQAKIIACHNMIGYDLPLIKKFYPDFRPNEILDTFILSQMLYPNERMTHGLDEWGKIVGVLKPKQEQWQVFNEQMLHRCVEDVKINVEVLKWCLIEVNKDNWDWSFPIKLEHEVAKINQEQGTLWKIDLKLLDKKIIEYNDIYNKINNQLRQLRKPFVIQGKEIAYKIQSGNISAAAKLYKAEGDFCKISFKPFEPSSVTQLVEFLLSVGWKPESFTPKGKPSLRDDDLIGVPNHISNVVSDFRDAIHRKGVLEGFKKRAKPNGDIAMSALTCGTNTARFCHRVIANIQPEFKDLFIAREGYKLVGCDASQLEARIESHYTVPYDAGAYSRYLLEMDVHQFNADMWGVSRSDAKAPFYAMAYGCGGAKIAKMLNISEEQGKDIIKQHYETWTGLSMLIKDLERSLEKRGFLLPGKWGRKELNEKAKPYIKGIDGRKLYVRGMHKLKNTLIQSAGAIVTKLAMIYINKLIKELDIDARIVMYYHDSYTIEVINDIKAIEAIKNGLPEAVRKAGEYFKLRVPLVVDSGEGYNWHDSK